MRIFDDNSLSIGNTPLIRLNRVTDGAKATVLAKIEGRNPAYSVKCRIGASMVWDAEKRGILKPGKELIEPTSGNTGIALAFVGAARGYPVTLTMPETMSRRTPQGTESPGRESGADRWRRGYGRVDRATPKRLSPPTANAIVMLQQFKNPANPEIHFRTTGPEIWNDTEGAIDVFVSGIGTGGTITVFRDTSRRRRARKFYRWVWSRLPVAVIAQTLAGEPLRPGSAQDSRHRRRIHSGHARSLHGRSGGDGHQRGIH